MIVKFNLSDIEISGEWDENSRLLLLENVGGTIGLTGKAMGWKFSIQAMVETGLNNLICLRVNTIQGIPNFLTPLFLKFIIRVNRNIFKAEAITLRKDAVWIDPNKLQTGSPNFRVLIQPKTEVGSFQEKVAPKLKNKILYWVKEHGEGLAAEVIDLIMVLPDLVLLLIKLMKDQRVSAELKLKIALTLAYVISPVDLIPEALGSVLGFVDDTLAMAVLLAGLVDEIPNEIIRDNWDGRLDVLELIIKSKDLLSSMLPAKIAEKLVTLFSISKSEAAVSVDPGEK
jgi:uncharacterized membrane protein YkvA (DUF1232 family)